MFIEISSDGKIRYSRSNADGRPPVVRNKGNSVLDLLDDYTVIDIETTGLSVEGNDIIEISALKIRNNEVIDKFDSLVHNKYINSFITKLTGITTEMTLEAPKLKSVLNDFMNFIGDDTLIAHNANFDINFIYDGILKHHKKEFNNEFIDTLRMSRHLYKEFKSHKLKLMVKHLNIDAKPSHRGLDDCYSALGVYNKCKERALETNFDFKSVRKILKAKDIHMTDETSIDIENPIYDKSCAFTGTLSRMIRKDAMQLVVNTGGKVENGVTKKTDYLIMGIQDYAKFADGKESSKVKKANNLITEGQDLRIISEDDFYEFVFGVEIR